MDKTLKFTIITGILIISFSIFYYLVIFIPSKEKRIELLENQQVGNLNKCITTAEEENDLIWNSACSNGIGDWINICQGEQGENCTQCILPDNESARLNKLLDDKKAECYQLYSK